MQYLILVSSSASSLLQPCVHPEKASMSISYRKWRTTKGPFWRRIWTTRLPSSSISGVNLNASKLTRHLSFWISMGRPLFARPASVLFRWRTLYFFMWFSQNLLLTIFIWVCIWSRYITRNGEVQRNMIMVIGCIRPTEGRQGARISLFNSPFQPWRQLFQYPDLISQWCYEVVHIKYISELTVGRATEKDKTEAILNWIVKNCSDYRKKCWPRISPK